MTTDNEDEGLVDFIKWNKGQLLKEFADLNHCIPQMVEDCYPDEFNEFCRLAYIEDCESEPR
jgi:hypothetical protein